MLIIFFTLPYNVISFQKLPGISGAPCMWRYNRSLVRTMYYLGICWQGQKKRCMHAHKFKLGLVEYKTLTWLLNVDHIPTHDTHSYASLLRGLYKL